VIVKWPNKWVRRSRRGPAATFLLLGYLVLSVSGASAAAVSVPSRATTSHVVRPGETLSAIARQYGLTEAALAQANGLANPNLVYAGQQIVIPTAGGAAPAAAGAGKAIHVVRPGETLSAVAQRYGATEAAIAQANGIANPNLVYAGQQLLIPASGDTAAPPATATGHGAVLHVVQPGQTLSTIATQYGVSEPVLAQANGIANPSLIYAGQQLVIPAGGGAAAPLPVAAPRAGEVAELAAIVYAEAQASPVDFNEMLAVASVVRNRVEHVAAYPGDLMWFGGPGYHGVISNSREFPSYGTPRYWNFLAGTVGSGQEQVAAESAMQAAVQVYNGGSVYDFVFFQQAATRPSPRVAFASTHLGAHNFWSFRPECVSPSVPCS
jgi:LysM repeat protein